MTRSAVIAKLRQAWSWFVEGLVEALLWAKQRGRGATPFRLAVDDAEGILFAPDGVRLGILVLGEGAARFEPPDLTRRLAGSALDLVIPPAWLFRRALDPVATQSRPFLDAFVRHQIERITPWRADAVHHRILADPMRGDPNRLAVSVVLVPKRLVDRWLGALGGLGLTTINLRTVEGVADAIRIGGVEAPGVATLRRGVTWGLATLAVATILMCGVLEWQAIVVSADVDEQDRVLDDRKAVLARARLREGTGDDLATKVYQLRDARPAAVAIIDALATAVPDTAHLTALSIEKDRVSISGLSTDPSALVPALETSGRFADVASTAATTRTETGDADRFSLTMRALPRRPGRADALGGSAPEPPASRRAGP